MSESSGFELGFSYPEGGEVHVTPHFSLTGETNEPKSPKNPLSNLTARLDQKESFCDWVSMYQTHDHPVLVLADGSVIRLDSQGNQESITLRKMRIEGSHDSSIYIRSDGHTVWFDGNVSKLGRPDNVFGYTFAQCLTRINAVCMSLGLPPFSTGQKMQVNTPSGPRSHWTGARVTRLDLTQNFASGSKENAYHFMRFLSMQQASRLKTGTFGDGETVDFGRKSRRVYSKAYLKGPELLRHAGLSRKTPTQILDSSKPGPDQYLISLAEWCNSIGLVRFETTYKSTHLISNGQSFLGGLNMQHLEHDFKTRQEVFTRANCDVDELASLDKRTLSVYRMWEAGDDVSSQMSRATFYRYRAALLPYGVDISVKSNVIKFQPKTRIISLSPVTQPSFYQFPSPNHIRLAA